jgi:hypothetical protein
MNLSYPLLGVSEDIKGFEKTNGHSFNIGSYGKMGGKNVSETRNLIEPNYSLQNFNLCVVQKSRYDKQHSRNALFKDTDIEALNVTE